MNFFLTSLLKLLTRSEKRTALKVGALATASAVFEAIGVLSIVPFLSVVGDQSKVNEEGYIAKAYSFLSVDSVNDFIIILGIGSFVFIVFAAFFRTMSEYFVTKFVQFRRHSIATRLLEVYLRQPYAFFITRHSSDLAKEILSEVDALILSVVQPTAAIITNAMSLLVLTILLLSVDPIVAISAGAVLIVVYFAIFRILKPIVGRSGVTRRNANKDRFEALSEALGGIKMIKLYGHEDLYMKRFSGPSELMAAAITTSTISGRMPKYLVESVAFGGIILLSLALIIRAPGDSSSSSSLLPLLGLYGFCGYRMLPAIQNIYLSVTQIRFGTESLKNLVKEMETSAPVSSHHNKSVPSASSLNLDHAITFQNVYYQYPGNSDAGMTDISLKIPRGASLGIVGKTGAGKTTFIDLFLGLLIPTQGRIFCDDIALTEQNLPAWRANVGYVPQEILLANSTIKANIAFGVKDADIDMEKVKLSARIAQIDEFIVNELSEGYDTNVGERGIRLSGGQRQRIGIARALYADPEILVLDEATSALDTVTEAKVMEGIRHMGKSKTLLIVAHRHSTLESCDQIVQLESGRIKRIGNFGLILGDSENDDNKHGSGN